MFFQDPPEDQPGFYRSPILHACFHNHPNIFWKCVFLFFNLWPTSRQDKGNNVHPIFPQIIEEIVVDGKHVQQDCSCGFVSKQATAEVQLVLVNSLRDTADVKQFVQKVSAVAGDIKKSFYSPSTFTVQFILYGSAESTEFQTVGKRGNSN